MTFIAPVFALYKSYRVDIYLFFIYFFYSFTSIARFTHAKHKISKKKLRCGESLENAQKFTVKIIVFVVFDMRVHKC